MAEDFSKARETTLLEDRHAADHAEVAHTLLCCLRCGELLFKLVVPPVQSGRSYPKIWRWSISWHKFHDA